MKKVIYLLIPVLLWGSLELAAQPVKKNPGVLHAQKDTTGSIHMAGDDREPVSEEKIFTSIEKQPEFPGGQGELMRYLSTNLVYPKSAREAGIEGRVVVQFVVCADGSLCNEQIVRSVDTALDREVLRVTHGMPRWKPGMNAGKPVKVYYTLPVTFKIDEEEEAEPGKPEAPEKAE